jgi:hypothetical protein
VRLRGRRPGGQSGALSAAYHGAGGWPIFRTNQLIFSLMPLLVLESGSTCIHATNLIKNISLYMSGCSFVFLLPRSEMTRFDNCEICIKHMLIVMFFGVVWLIKNTNLMILLIDRQWLARGWGYPRYLLISTFPSRRSVISLSRRLVRSKPRAPPSQ